MQKSKDLVIVGHIANPCIPRGVFEAVPKPCQGKENDDDGERRVCSGRDVGEEVTEWTDDSYSTLSPFEVYHVVGKSRGCVAHKG